MAIRIVGIDPEVQKEVVHGIIDTVGRDVVFTRVISTGICPTCSGNNPFCVTCSGEPNIEYTENTTITGSVKWGTAENKIYMAEGQYVEGDCLVTIKVDDGIAITTDHFLQRVKDVIVDNRKCILDKWYFKGSPINRCYVVLREDENLSGQRI